MNTVDERIVEMRFDNDQFEHGVDTSLKSLEKLKKGLDLSGAADSLSTLQTTADSFNISGISDNVDKIANRFSVFGIVADEAIRRVTDSLFSLGERATQTIKSLTIDQIPVGFDKYERKIQSVQTIMNATGYSIDKVNESLDKLNWYTDETSYNFSDMVDNIGKFTSSRVPLETAVTSMIGIANAAGLAGASTQDASHAMEGFSKAIAQGYMSRQNWQWIRTAHMDTAQFKETLLEAAAAEGTLGTRINETTKELEYYVKASKDQAIVSVADFETAMKDAWLTTNVMNRALGEFGGTTETIYSEFLRTGELTSEIIAQMGTSADDLGLRAFKASQEAKTFSDAINSVKDAVSTGWMVSFEEIFGNYEEAKILWTNVANELWDVFASGAERRNEMLSEWHELGGYKDSLDAISNLWAALKAIGEVAKEVFEEFFPPITSRKLLDFTRKLKTISVKIKAAFTVEDVVEFSDTLRHRVYDFLDSRNEKAEKNLETLKNAFSGLFSIARLGESIFKSLITILSPLTRLFSTTGKSLFDLSGSLGEIITKTVDAIIESEKYKSIVDGLTNAVSSFTTFILNGSKAIKNFYKDIKKSEAFKSFINTILEGASNLQSSLAPYIDKASAYLSRFFNELANFDFSKIKVGIGIVTESFSKVIGKMVEFYYTAKTFLSPYISQLANVFKSLSSKVSTTATNIYTFWKNLYDSGEVLSFILGKFDSFKEKLSEVGKSVLNFIRNIDLSTAYKKIKEFLDPLKERLETFISETKTRLENLDLGKVAALGLAAATIPTIISISVAFSEAAKLLKGSRGLVSNLNDILSKFKDGFKSKLMETAKAVTVFSISIGILAASMKLISTIDSEQIRPVLTSLVALTAALTAMSVALGLLGRFKLLGDIKGTGLAMLELAGSIAILAGSMVILDAVKTDNLLRNLEIIISLMAALTSFSIILSRVAPELKNGSLTIIAFSASILILSKALDNITGISQITNIWDVVGVIMALMAAMTAVSAIAGKIKFGSGIGMLGLVGSIFLLLRLFEKLSNESIETMAKKAEENLGFIAATIGVLASLALVSWLGGSHASKTGFAILAMSASIMILYEAIKRIGDIENNIINKGLAVITGILLIFALLSKSTMYAGKDSAKAGAAILGMSASLLIVYLAIKKIGELDIGTMGKGLIAVIGLLLTFSVLLASLRGVNSSFGTILAISIAIATLTAALSYLTLFSWPDLIKSGTALITALVSLGAAMRLASGIKFTGGSVVGFISGILALGTIAWALSKVSEYNWSSLAAAGGAISGCLLAMAKAIEIASNAKFDKDANLGTLLGAIVALLAIAVIGAVLEPLATKPWESMLAAAGAISLVLYAISKTGEGLSNAASTLSKVPFKDFAIGLGELLLAIAGIAAVFLGISWLVGNFDVNGKIAKGAKNIGEAIGGLIGGLIGNGLESAASHLPAVAESLSAFIEKAAGFFDGINNLGPDVGKSFLNLVEGLKKLTKLDIGSGNVDGGEVNLLNQSLSMVADALVSFSEKAENINLLNINIGITAAEQLNALLTALEPSGGLVQKIFGERSWNNISEGLTTFAEGMKDFSNISEDINNSFVKNGVKAGELLNDLLHAIPEDNGLLQKIFGNKTWSTISEGLEQFAIDMAAFSTASKDIVSDNLDKGVAAGSALNELLKALPESPGTIKQFFGKGQEWSTISTGLTDFGTAVVTFSTAMNDFVPSSVDIAITSIGQFPPLMKALQDAGMADKNINLNIRNAIVGLVDSLIYFSTNAAEISSENIKTAFDAVTVITEAGEQFSAAGTALGESITKALEDTLSPTHSANVGLAYITSLNSALISMKSAVISASSNIGEWIVNGSMVKVYSISDAATKYINTFITSIRANTNLVYSAGISIGSEVILGVSEKSSEMSNVGLRYIDNFISGVSRDSSNGNQFYNAGSYIGSSVVNGASAVVNDMYYIGINAVQGFINGIYNMSYYANYAGNYLAQVLVNSMRTTLDINSPSRVLMGLGEYGGEGFAIGFLNKINMVKDSAETLANEAIDSISLLLSSLNDDLDMNIDSNPVITPVLDLSKVDSEFGNLNRRLSSAVTLSLSNKVNSPESSSLRLNELASTGSTILREIQNGNNVEPQQTSNVFNIYAQPGQNVDEIASAVERKLNFALKQRKAAGVQ